MDVKPDCLDSHLSSAHNGGGVSAVSPTWAPASGTVSA